MRMRLVLVGHGMVGHRLLAELSASGVIAELDVTVFGEEPRLAYDRVALSSFFDGASADDLGLVEPGFAERHGVRIVSGDPVVLIDRGRRAVTTASGEEVSYDHVVLATGSAPFV